MKCKFSVGAWPFAVGLLVAALAAPGIARSHCDTLDGPVVSDARVALEKGDATPVLKWVRAEDETTIRAALGKTLAVRALGPEAREMADLYFFETLVRIHRAGEGFPYTGLAPAGSRLPPAVAEADRALAVGSDATLVKRVADDVTAALHMKFQRAAEAKKHVDESVGAGRAFVAAYVDFMHYVEKLHEAGSGGHAHGAEVPGETREPGHEAAAHRPEAAGHESAHHPN